MQGLILACSISVFTAFFVKRTGRCERKVVISVQLSMLSPEADCGQAVRQNNFLESDRCSGKEVSSGRISVGKRGLSEPPTYVYDRHVEIQIVNI